MEQRPEEGQDLTLCCPKQLKQSHKRWTVEKRSWGLFSLNLKHFISEWVPEQSGQFVGPALEGREELAWKILRA